MDATNPQINNVYNENLAIIERLGHIAGVEDTSMLEISTGPRTRLDPSRQTIDVAVVYERKIDVAAEREQLDQGHREATKKISPPQIANWAIEGFTAKAPAHIVDGLKKQRTKHNVCSKTAQAALDSLPLA